MKKHYYAFVNDNNELIGVPGPKTGKCNNSGRTFKFETQRERDLFCAEKYIWIRGTLEVYPIACTVQQLRRFHLALSPAEFRREITELSCEYFLNGIPGCWELITR